MCQPSVKTRIPGPKPPNQAKRLGSWRWASSGSATVKAIVVAHGRADKVTIFKMRRRKHYQKHQGHRQNYTEIKIDSIVG